MKDKAKGLIKFDPLLVIGRDWLPSVHNNDPAFYDYAFGVSAYISSDKPKKGKPLEYSYHWSGHFNIGLASARIHLHNINGDVECKELENKLIVIKEQIAAFLKEHRARMKTPAKKELNVRQWLNPLDTHYTGYISYQVREDGGGMMTIADCSRSLHWYLDVWKDEKGKLMDVDYLNKHIKQVEALAKGVNKAIGAIQQLRKFFDREMESDGN